MPIGIPVSHEVVANKILPDLIAGKTGLQIAADTGLDNSTISKWKSKLADQLQAYQIQLLEQSGQNTVNNITATIDRANRVLSKKSKDGQYRTSSKDLSDYKDLLQLSHKKEVLVAQAMGILPSHTQSTVINNIFNQQTNIIADPKLHKMMSRYASDDVTDVDLDIDDNELYSESPDIIDV